MLWSNMDAWKEYFMPVWADIPWTFMTPNVSLCIARGNLSYIRSVLHCLGSWPSKMHVRTTLFFYHCFHLWFILFLCFLAVYVWTEECFKFSQRTSRFLIYLWNVLFPSSLVRSWSVYSFTLINSWNTFYFPHLVHLTSHLNFWDFILISCSKIISHSTKETEAALDSSNLSKYAVVLVPRLSDDIPFRAFICRSSSGEIISF